MVLATRWQLRFTDFPNFGINISSITLAKVDDALEALEQREFRRTGFCFKNGVQILDTCTGTFQLNFC